MAENKKKFGRSNVDAVKERAENLGGGDFGDVNWINLDAGKNVIRVLPPLGDNQVPWADGYLHFGLGDAGKTTVTCRKTWGKNEPCPVCELVEKLKKSKSKADRDLGERIGARKRFYLNVIDRDAEGTDKEYGVLGCGVTIVKEISALMTDPDYAGLDDPDEGFDLTITKTGTGLNTEYKVIPKRNPSPLGGSLDEDETLERCADLESLFVDKSYDELVAVIDGTDEDGDDGDDGADEGHYDDWTVTELIAEVKSRGAKPVSTNNKVKLIAQLEEMDEEPEPPAKQSRQLGKGKGAAKPDVDPEDDDDNGDDGDSEDGDDGDDSEEIEKALRRAAGNKGGNRNGRK